MPNGWNFADVFEVFADLRPNDPAVSHGDSQRTWGEFDRHADGIATCMLAGGTTRGDRVALYLFNCNEYVESLFACFKAGLVPANTNYRYEHDELAYLWDNADATAVIFHGCFADKVDSIRNRTPAVKTWLWVDDGSGSRPEWAIDYATAADSASARVIADGGRSGDDELMLYTGGTTGMPKGVRWRQDDLFVLLNGGSARKYGPDANLSLVRESATRPGTRSIPGCPLMHGTGLFIALGALTTGGLVISLESRKFDVIEFLDTIERERAELLAIVGDAFGKPMVSALDENPDRWDLSSLKVITSSGVMFSEPVKQALLRHHPGMILADLYGSSEGIGLGRSVSSAKGSAKTATFKMGDHTLVIDDNNRPVEPGSGQRGRVALCGRVPLGYHKDPDKTAATFPVIDGVRYSVPGDFAIPEADGTITLLGRGSVCINSAGEKIFPEEVEEAIKTLDGVHDAVAIGLPDDRFGEVVTALVEATSPEVSPYAVIEHVKSRLASYKAPKHVILVDSIGRSPNGKVDYRRLTALAADRLGVKI